MKNRSLSLFLVLVLVLTSVCGIGTENAVAAEESAAITLENAPENDFTAWTFSDLGIMDQTVTADLNWKKPSAEVPNLDRTIFHGRILFPDEGNIGNFYIGGSPETAASFYGGFLLRGNTDGSHSLDLSFQPSGANPVRIANLYPDTAGVSIRGNADLLFSMSVEYLNTSDGLVNARVGIFFDGRLYNNTYFTVNGLEEAALTRFVKWKAPAGSPAVKSYPEDVKILEDELDSYERIDMLDYQCTGARSIDPLTGIMGFTTYDEAKALISDFDHTYLDIDVSFAGTAGNYIRVLGEARWRNMFSLYVKNGSTIGLQYLNEAQQNIDITEFQISDYDISWGEFFNIKFRTDITALDPSKDKISVQLWLNGRFAYEGDTVFTYSSDEHTRSYFYIKSNEDLVRSDVSESAQLEGYKKTVPGNFDQLVAGRSEHGAFNNSARAGAYTGDSLDRTYFDADIKASGTGQPLLAWLTKSVTNRDFYGDGEQLVFYIDGSVLKMQEIHGGRGKNTETVSIGDMSAAPYSYADGEFFNLKLRTRIYDSGVIGLLVYINDSLLGVVYVTAATTTPTNNPAKFTALYSRDNLEDMNWAGLRGTVDYPIYVRTPAENLKLKDVTYDVSEGGYLLAGASVFRVNGEQMNAGDVISAPGEYMIERIVDGRTASTQKVTLVSGRTFPGSLTYDYLGKDVMPVVGFYGPSSIVKSTDEVYRLISGSGINIISYLPLHWTDGSEAVLRNLELAEKYGIGIYIKDPALNTLELDTDGVTVLSQSNLSTAQELAQAMEQYAAYSSFLGIHVFDEPKPDNDPSNEYSSANNYARFGYYRGILQALQPYVNVTGYINLHGEGTFYDDEDYVGYLASVIDDVDILSFDTYPYFNTQYSSARLRDYLDSLDIVATFSRRYDKPFWSYAQAGTDYRDGGADGATTARYTEADTLWIVNTSLAFGAKGVGWFPMMQPEFFSYDSTSESGHDYERNGLIGADNEPNRYYSMVKRANNQIAAVDGVLMNAAFKGVVADGKAASDITFAQTTGKKHKFDNIITKTDGKYTDRFVSLGTGGSEGAMVGCFDYMGSEAYYAVNYSREENGTQRITLGFDDEHNFRVIRNGQESRLSSVSSVTVYPDSGEGVLIVIDDGAPDVINGKESSTDAATLYMNAEISDMITAVFRAELKGTAAGQYDDIVLRASVGGSVLEDIAPEETGGTLVFRIPDIYSQHMTDVIKADLIGIKGSTQTVLAGITDGISIAGYCDLVAQNYSYDSELMAFAANMLRFGEACQRYTSYRTDDLACAGRSWVAENAVSAAPVSTAGLINELDPAYPGSDRIYAAGLSIADRISIYFNVYSLNTDGLTLSVSGAGTDISDKAVSELTKNGSSYRVDLKKISPTEYDSAVTASLAKNGTVIQTVSYSVNAYCADNAKDSALTDLVSAIYDFGLAASAFAD